MYMYNIYTALNLVHVCHVHVYNYEQVHVATYMYMCISDILSHIDLSGGHCSLGLNCGLQRGHGKGELSLQLVQMLRTGQDVSLHTYTHTHIHTFTCTVHTYKFHNVATCTFNF